MVKISATYEGNLKCSLIHGPSGTLIYTDAPQDVGGKAEAFSPTDLMAAALVSCIATTIGIYAQRKGWNLAGMRLEVSKEMSTGPDRRILRLPVQVWMPINLSNDERQQCERVAATCPVHKSLHPGIEVHAIFRWPTEQHKD